MVQVRKKCPNGSRRNKKTGNCVSNTQKKRRRCPNGSRRNKKTDMCVKNKITKEPVKSSIKEVFQKVDLKKAIGIVCLDAHPDNKLKKEYILELNSVLDLIANDVVAKSVQLYKSNGLSAIDHTVILNVAMRILPKNIAKYVENLILKYIKPEFKNTMCFSPLRCKKYFQPHNVTLSNGDIALAALLESICYDLAEITGNTTIQSGENTTTIPHLINSIEQDSDFKKFLFNQYGYTPPLKYVYGLF